MTSSISLVQSLYSVQDTKTLSWYDQEIWPHVQELETTLTEKASEFQQKGIELHVDKREKERLRHCFRHLSFVKEQSYDCGDFYIFVRGKKYKIIERKTWTDQTGSIGGRSDTQHLKLFCVPIPHHRKYYLFEAVSETEWKDHQTYQQQAHYSSHASFSSQGKSRGLNEIVGSKANIMERDQFNMIETQSLLDTVFTLFKIMLKVLENADSIIKRLAAEPEVDLKALQSSSEGVLLEAAKSNEVYWWTLLGTDISCSASTLQQITSAAKDQGKSKKRKISEHLGSDGKNKNIKEQWVMQLAQIPKMSVPKALIVSQKYATLIDFVDASKLSPKDVWSSLKQFEFHASVSDMTDDDGEPKGKSRKLGPALASQLLQWIGIEYPQKKG